MELSIFHEVEHSLEEFARLIEVFFRSLMLIYLSAYSHVGKVVKHYEPQWTEDSSKLFDLLREFFLPLEENEAELNSEVRNNCELILLVIHLERWHELCTLLVKHAKYILQ